MNFRDLLALLIPALKKFLFPTEKEKEDAAKEKVAQKMDRDQESGRPGGFWGDS